MTKQEVLDLLKAIYDPEIGLDIVNLGLIYRIDISEDGKSVDLDMTLTSVGCPIGPTLINMVEEVLKSKFENVSVNVVFDPPWTPEMISDEGKQALGLFY
ncbi:MAG: metal-sulfur cluster assembly factor [Spirochaetia bacterium]|nr:metal-sulfur cluster assembly factor [Spirochaetota bacterium]MCX8097020.1 metal-sulfur cluster assembly factor [Spirochaetota bacterium]MDW8111897.1 metal-sulfur cluster assembly factor [Spirochaetia bacterium]